MTRRGRRALAALTLGMVCVTGLAGCSEDADDDSGAVTNLEEVGPDVAELQAQVTELITQVQELQARVAELEQNNPPPPG